MSDCRAKATAHRAHGAWQGVRKSHGRLCATFLTTLLVTTALTSPSGPAHAQCAPDPAAAGDNVVCGPNPDTDGFTFDGTGNLGSFTILPGVVVNDSTLVGPSIAVVEIFSAGPNNPGVTGNVTINGSILDTGPSSIGLRVEGPIGGTLLNAGTIIGDQDGINVGRIGGDFTNMAGGVITGGQVGVFSFDITGAFTNAGTITATGFAGIEVDGNAGVFANMAGGVITGGETGLLVTGDMTGAFTNAGTITGTNSIGVSVEGGTSSLTNMAGGIISGAVDGVRVTRSIGAFTNAGTIAGGVLGDGVFVGGSTGAVTNMAGGMITGGGGGFSDALDIEGDLIGNFINDGTMSVAGGGTDSDALDIGGDLIGNLVNNGTMSVAGIDFDGDAIDIFGSLSGDFLNTKTISAASSGDDSDALDIGDALDGNFMNTGTMSGSGSSGNALDVDFITGSFFNSGMMMGTDAGVAIEDGTIARGFTNAGMIDGDTDQDSDGAGVKIFSNGGQAATFMNMAGGMITGAIGFDSEEGDEAVTNAGMIVGRTGTSIDLGTGADSLTLTTGSTLDGTALGGGDTDAFFITGVVNEDDNILDFETFTFLGDNSGRSILSGIVNTPTNMMTSGTLLANGALGAAGGTTTVMSGSTLGGTGTVLGTTTVQGGGNLAPGASIGTLINNGDVAFNAGSIFTIEADGVTNSADLLIVNGSVVIDGATLSYGVVPGGAISPLQATTFVVLANDGADPITGSGFAAVTPFSPFVTATASTTAGDGNDVALTITADFTTVPGTTLTLNQTNTARALNSLTVTPGSDSARLASALFGLSVAEAPNALDQLSGEIYASLANVFIPQARIVTDGIGNRLSRLQAGIATPSIAPLAFMGVSMAPRQIAEAFSQVERAGAAPAHALGPSPTISDRGSLKAVGAVEAAPQRYELWVRSLGRFADFDGDGNASGIESSAGAILVGGDMPIAPGLRVGLAAGYSRTNAEIDTLGNDLDADSFLFLAYGAAVNGPWHAKAIASYGLHDLDVTRSIAFGTFAAIAQSDLVAHQLTGYMELGRTWTFDYGSGASLTDGAAAQGRKLAVQPVVALRASYLNRGGFTETGAGAANLTASDEDFAGIEPIVGLRLSTEFTSGDVTWIPQARIAWSYMDGNIDPPEADLAFVAGGAFTIAGNERDRNGVTIGTGLNALVGKSAMAFADYSATLSSDLDDHQVSGGVRMRF